MNHQLDTRTGIREALPTVFLAILVLALLFGIVGQASRFFPSYC